MSSVLTEFRALMKSLISLWLLSIAGLLLLGWLALDSATLRSAHPERLQGHLIWLSLGLAGCLAMAQLRYTRLQQHGLPWLCYGVAVALLVLVLLPGLAEDINGARRWFRCGGQPSELAKLTLILALADYASCRLESMGRFKSGFLVPISAAGLMAGLIFREPDWGTAVLTMTVALAVLLVAGARWHYACALILAAGLLAIPLLQRHPERQARLRVFVERESGNHRDVWQVWHSVLSFAAGGIWGTSPGEGTHRYGFVAEQETDFIFSLVGEELGLAGTSTMVILYTSLIVLGVMIAWRVADPFGQLLVLGVTLMIGLQAIINLGVVTNILPNKGLPLPFVSYGGSNLVALLAGVGWVISVARYAPSAKAAAATLLERVSFLECGPTPAQPFTSPEIRHGGWFRRRLLRFYLGPHWTYWLAIRHAYQRPPVKDRCIQYGRIQRWLRTLVLRLLPGETRAALVALAAPAWPPTRAATLAETGFPASLAARKTRARLKRPRSCGRGRPCH